MASFFRRLRHAGRTILGNEKGGMSMFMAAGVVASVGIAGVSVDAIRGYLVQSRLSSALDAAGLAGARVMFSPTRDADIQMYFDANFPAGYLGATVTGPVFSVDASEEVLTLTAQATIGTTLTQVLGFDHLTVSANSEITRQTEMLDVILAVDMSGSMNKDVAGNNNPPAGTSRIELARDAALEMVDILYGTDGLAPLLNIGLVPWSGKVNVANASVAFDAGATVTVPTANFTNPITGASQSSVFLANNSPVPLLSTPPAAEPFTDSNANGVFDSGESYTDTNGSGEYDYAWQGCVFARFTDDGSTNDADMTVGPIMGVSGADWPAWEVMDWQAEPDAAGDCPLAPSFCVPCLSQGITPLQTTKAAITAAINGLTNPAPVGSTEMIGGLAWAWRALLPAAPFTEADPDPDGQRTQAIILLTDGKYTGWYNDSYREAFGHNNDARPDGPNRLRSLATLIKDSGVVIYTIQFAEASTELEDLMKDVASGPDAPFYNKAPTAAQLQQVFREVANDLSQLRVSM